MHSCIYKIYKYLLARRNLHHSRHRALRTHTSMSHGLHHFLGLFHHLLHHGHHLCFLHRHLHPLCSHLIGSLLFKSLNLLELALMGDVGESWGRWVSKGCPKGVQKGVQRVSKGVFKGGEPDTRQVWRRGWSSK